MAGSAIPWSQCSVGKKRMLQYKLKITGVVQGVGFRYFVRQEAARLELAGAVWNCPDGSVEVVVQGEEALLEQLVEQCKLGPTYSKVATVDVERDEVGERLVGFEIRR